MGRNRKRFLIWQFVILPAWFLVVGCQPETKPHLVQLEPTATPPKSNGGINVAEAETLIEKHIKEADYPYDFGNAQVRDITTSEIWEQFQVQFFSYDYNTTFMIKDEEVNLFHRGVFGGEVTSMLPADLNADGQIEMVYVSSVSLSGVYHDCVSIAFFDEAAIERISLVEGYLQSFALRKHTDQSIEILTSYYNAGTEETGWLLVGEIAVISTDDEDQYSLVLNANLPEHIKEALTLQNVACSAGEGG